MRHTLSDGVQWEGRRRWVSEGWELVESDGIQWGGRRRVATE